MVRDGEFRCRGIPCMPDAGAAKRHNLSFIREPAREAAGIEMLEALEIVVGIALLILTVVLFMWGVPKGGKPSRVPDKWGMGTAFPIIVMCSGVFGIVFLLKGIFP